jgi:hypothetical protein
MYLSRTKKWYHFEADLLIWPNGPFKFEQNKNCFFPFFLWQEAGRFGKENSIKQFRVAFCSQKIYYLFHARNKQSLNTLNFRFTFRFHWSSTYCSALYPYILYFSVFWADTEVALLAKKKIYSEPKTLVPLWARNGFQKLSLELSSPAS